MEPTHPTQDVPDPSTAQQLADAKRIHAITDSVEPSEDSESFTTDQVARIFKVDPETVRRWEKRGLLSASRTLGGHRRFDAAEVRAVRGRQLRDKIAGRPNSLAEDQGDENADGAA